MKASRFVLLGLPLLAISASFLASADDDERRSLRARLSGFQEPPSVSSTGSGSIRVMIAPDGQSAYYELEFKDLEGDVTQAHIHMAQPGVNGGIMVWLCGTAALPGPAGTPNCGGPKSGSASRTITPADIIGPAGQGVAAGEFAEFVRALRAGYAYANVHSTRNAGGEIRGQLRGGRDD